MGPNDDPITEMHIFLTVERDEWKEDRTCVSEMTEACGSPARRTYGSEAADALPERANYIAGTS